MSLARLEQKVFGILKETVRGTVEAAATGARYLPVSPASEITLNPNLIANEKLFGDPEERAAASGPRDWGGTLELEPSADKLGEFLYSLMGAVTTTEQAAILITLNVNDKIDFDIGAGALVATIAAGSYLIGTTSATAGTLCEAIKDALSAADGAGTYTVTYSVSTRKFTIVKSAGTLNIQWLTGASITGAQLGAGSTLGYTADDTGALTYVGDSAVRSVYSHVFVKADGNGQHPMYTLFVDRQVGQKKYNGLTVGQMTFDVPVDGRLKASCDVLCKAEAAGEVLTPDFANDLNDLTFADVTVEVAGASSELVRSANIAVARSPARKRVLTADRDCADIVQGPLRITGSFVLFWEDDVERAKFVANTSTSLKITFTGQTIRNALPAKLILYYPEIQLSAGPAQEVDGILVKNFSFKAVRNASAGYSFQATLQNEEGAY